MSLNSAELKGKEGVMLAFSGASAAFRDGAISVEVAPDHLRRSQLLQELQERGSDADEIPVPLSLDDLQAWTSWLENGKPSSSACDRSRLRALEAATFLRDDTSIAEIVRVLCLAFSPELDISKAQSYDADQGPAHRTSMDATMEDCLSDDSSSAGYCRKPPPPGSLPTEQERERAMKILEAAPAHAIHSIITAVHPAADSTGRFDPEFQKHAPTTLAYLLLLLPPSLHPAVLHMRCPSIQRDRSLSIPDLLQHSHLDCTSPQRASPTVSALAAAAVFAGGSPSEIWGSAAAADAAAALEQLSTQPLPLQPLHPRGTTKQQHSSNPDSAAAPSAGATTDSRSSNNPTLPTASALLPTGILAADRSLTRLTLSLPTWHQKQWAPALHQLHTLCELRLQIFSPNDSVGKRLASAAAGMPALTRLHVRAEEPDLLEGSMMGNGVQELLAAVSHLPRLAALRLERCFFTKSDFARRKPKLPKDATVDQLSRLTALTELSLRDNMVSRQDLLPKLVKALRRMKRLEQLSVSNMDEGPDGVLDMYTRQELPALRALDVGQNGMHRTGRWLTAWDALREREGFNAGLTALGFEQCGAGIETSGLPAKYLTPWPKLFPGLRRVSLQRSSIQDVGLQALAAILPNMHVLDTVNVGFNGGTHEGVFALMAAAAKLAGAGGTGGLRRLSVAGAAVGPEKAPELADLLRGLTELEEADMAAMDLRGEGVAAVARALPALPNLHGVNLSDNGQSEGDVEGLVPLLAAATGLRRLVMHEAAVVDAEGVRREVDRAAPWLTGVTLGAAHEVADHSDSNIVAFHSTWKPIEDRSEEMF